MNAATEVIGGVTYEVIYLTSDSNANLQKVNATTTTGNYHFILQADWDLSTLQNNPTVRGASVIWDFNGYGVNRGGGHHLQFNSIDTLELTDSSPVWHSQLGTPFPVFSGRPRFMYVSGNVRMILEIWATNFCNNIKIRSANYFQLYLTTGTSIGNTGFTFPAFMQLAPVTSDNVRTFTSTSDYYLVSTVNHGIVSGAYNYEFGGYVTDLTVGELSKLAVPTDKTYYLWGRNADGAYEYLNIVYRDGAWVKAA